MAKILSSLSLGARCRPTPSIETDGPKCYVQLVSGRTLWVVLVAAGMVNAQPRFPMKYLDEVGHLGGLDKSQTARIRDLSLP